MAFSTNLRVRWSEVDMQKVVFNGNYLNYFDVAFTDFWRTTGLPSVVDQQAAGAEMFAKKASVEYHAPAHFDDMLDITVAPVKLGNTSVVFQVNIHRADVAGPKHIVQGELVYVYVDTTTMRPIPWPAHWREKFQSLLT